MTAEEIGQAYRAFSAFNWKAKRDRIARFDPQRWGRVVRAINGITLRNDPAEGRRKGVSGTKWTPERREKFKATMARKSRERAKFNGLRSHA
jgi:hypothetical protein